MAEARTTPVGSRIRTADGRVEHAVTAEELLWLGRALAGEGGDSAAVLWTFVTGWAVKAPQQPLSRYVQSYSQAISPLWLAEGACCCGEGACPAGRSYCGDPQYCSEAQTAARARRRAVPWTGLPAAIQTLLINWAHGRVLNPVPGATDFAATGTGLVNRRLEAGWIKVADLRGNTHLLPPDAVRPAGYVTVCGPEGCASDGPTPRGRATILALAFGALLGVGGAYLWTQRRGRQRRRRRGRRTVP